MTREAHQEESRLLLPVGMLDEHPDHDGIYRQDIIAQIAADLISDQGHLLEWPRRHAISVRRIGDRYQVISGHHRRRAAIEAGCERVWCDVEEMSDEEATIRLITDNKQGEKSPLQIGINVLRFEARSSGGRGKKGGLSEYARRIGKSQSYIAELRSAAEVAMSKPIAQAIGLRDKSKHLLAIHKLPEGMWGGAVERLIEEPGLTVAEVKSWVDSLLRGDEGNLSATDDLIIDPEFQSTIPPAGAGADKVLEDLLLEHGCRHPITVWGKTVIDGHRRLAICRKHGIPFQVDQIELRDRDEAIEKIINIQCGRKNLNGYQQLELALKLEKSRVGE